ncbi:hypothetical protein DOY81_011033 [Sarcophaga bullata]|nr:hypothetical protein DOY81_011033 [Sarcophaga bullata]
MTVISSRRATSTHTTPCGAITHRTTAASGILQHEMTAIAAGSYTIATSTHATAYGAAQMSTLQGE